MVLLGYNWEVEPTKHFLVFFVAVLLLFGLFFVPLQQGRAFFGPSGGGGGGGAIPFGGMILTAIPCICDGTIWITVGAPKGGSFIVEPGDVIVGSPVPGVWSLGNASAGVKLCKNPICKGACCPMGAGLPVDFMGTSG